MCLLTFMSEYTTANVDDLLVGAENNPDGFGYAVHTGKKIIHNSGLSIDRVLDEFLAVRAKHSGPALFHSRITTHGGTTLENCHPFQVGRDELTIVAHNGMLPIKAKNNKSDTRIFAEEMLPQMGGASILNSKKQRKKLAKFASGSKLVFLSANPSVNENFHIINERDGHWDKGVWWSNSSYKYARHTYQPSGVTMYTSGWSHTDDGVDEYRGSKYVTDCSYVDMRTGEEVWGELWTCQVCGNQEYFDDANIHLADLCPTCDACWFCHSERILCTCYQDTYNNKSNYVPTHSVGNYDSTIDNWSF